MEHPKNLRRPSSKYLENLKNKAMLKLKVKESMEILPKDCNILLTNTERVKFI